MRRSLRLLMLLALAAPLLGACGPTYPDCEKDDHCASHDQVCVDLRCVDCRDDRQCAGYGPCGACGPGNTCAMRPGCCTSDLDCGDKRCWMQPGAPSGVCGGDCLTSSHCPAGQMCVGERCVPDRRCTGDADCAEGELCEAGLCVTGACRVEAIRFDFGAASIRLDMESTLSANAKCIELKGTPHRVEGHCDERGSDEFNLALGQRRAAAIARQYRALGVPNRLLSVISYGEERPACHTGGDTCWSENRRVETLPE